MYAQALPYTGMRTIQVYFQRPNRSFRSLRLNRLTEFVFSVFQCSTSEITGERLKGQAMEAKRISFYLANKYLKYSPTELEHRFGDDHSTVIYHIKRCADLIDTDPEIRETIQHIEKELNLI